MKAVYAIITSLLVIVFTGCASNETKSPTNSPVTTATKDVKRPPSPEQLVESLIGGDPCDIWNSIDTASLWPSESLAESLAQAMTSKEAEDKWAVFDRSRSQAFEPGTAGRRIRPRESAALALGRMGGPGVQALISLLKDSDYLVRTTSLEALSLTNDPRAVSAAAELLTASDLRLRLSAAQVLAWSNDPRAIEPLASFIAEPNLVYSPDNELVGMAIKALAQIDEPHAAEALLKVAEANQYPDDVQAVTLSALGMHRSLSAVDVIAEAIKPMPPGYWDKIRRTLNKFSFSRGSLGVNAYIESMKRTHTELRCRSARALGLIQDERCVGHLQRAMNEDEDEEVRKTALQSLERIRNRGQIPELIAAANHNDTHVRWQAAQRLGDVGDANAVITLKEALGDGVYKVRTEAARALAKIGDTKASIILYDALRRNDLDVIEAACSFFVARGRPGTEAYLIGMLYRRSNRDMAEVLLNSGNWDLEFYAMSWAHHRGLRPVKKSVSQNVRWGQW